MADIEQPLDEDPWQLARARWNRPGPPRCGFCMELELAGRHDLACPVLPARQEDS
ncbi:hypothetical protein ABZ867_11920 [Streptomyces cinnamoneus]